MRQDQFYISIKDIISEYIKDNVQQRKQKRIITLLHTPMSRHEGLNILPITYTRFSTKLHPQTLEW